MWRIRYPLRAHFLHLSRILHVNFRLIAMSMQNL